MFTLNCHGRLLILDQPVVMGIINITPDSFYARSRHTVADGILHHAEKMLEEGATILDVGGQSTRPGSTRVSAEEELKRIADPVAAIRKRFPSAFISIDTFYGQVAAECVYAGADLINDISAGNLDPGMFSTIAKLKVPYVLMHMQGTPETMQLHPEYGQVTKDVIDFITVKKHQLESLGVHDIIVDPGFGFGKTTEQNFELLRNLSSFRITRAPLLAGFSRKGMVYRSLEITPEEALNGTTTLNSFALLKGASILRVHDVKPAMEAIRLFGLMQTPDQFANK